MRQYRYIYVLVLFTLVVSKHAHSQVGIEFCGNYKYSMIENATNCNSWGGELFLTKDINILNIQIGLGYQSKNFTKNVFTGEDNQQAVYQLQYISFIPALVHVKIKKNDTYSLSTMGGLIIQDVVDYTIRNDIDKKTIAKNPSAGQGLSSSCRLGLSYSRIFSKFRVSCSPFVEYKIILDSTDDYEHSHEMYPHPYYTIPQDRWSCGITLGIAYIYKQ